MIINTEVVRLGYAQAATFPPDIMYQSLLLKLQQEARAAGRGLWGPAATAEPTPAPRAPAGSLTCDKCIKGNVSSSGEKI